MKKPLIVTVPNPTLKEPTKNVSVFDRALEDQIKIMVETLREDKGVGLAANQLGFKNKVIVAEFEDQENDIHIPLTVFINPEVVEISQENDCADEGCLSVPGVELEVERAKNLKIKYQNEKGQKIKFAPKGLLARILQHEIDHLNGILFVERAKEQLFKKCPELKKIKILFFGSGDYGAIILQGLILLGLNLKIVTEKSKLAGREKTEKPTPVAQMAKKFNKEVLEIENIKDFQSNEFDLLICSDFGQIIPENLLKNAKIKAINIHPSLLPKYRGASPIQSAILDDAKKTGVSIIEMSPKIDDGGILAQAPIDIEPDDDAETLKGILSILGLKLLVKALPEIIKGKLEAKPQDLKEVTLTHKFKKEDGEINWQKRPEEIYAQIRALNPWPGTYTIIENKRLIIRQAHLENNKIVLDIVQPEGKRPMAFQDFLRGYHGTKPEWFTKVY